MAALNLTGTRKLVRAANPRTVLSSTVALGRWALGLVALGEYEPAFRLAERGIAVALVDAVRKLRPDDVLGAQFQQRRLAEAQELRVRIVDLACDHAVDAARPAGARRRALEALRRLHALANVSELGVANRLRQAAQAEEDPSLRAEIERVAGAIERRRGSGPR